MFFAASKPKPYVHSLIYLDCALRLKPGQKCPAACSAAMLTAHRQESAGALRGSRDLGFKVGSGAMYESL